MRGRSNVLGFVRPLPSFSLCFFGSLALAIAYSGYPEAFRQKWLAMDARKGHRLTVAQL